MTRGLASIASIALVACGSVQAPADMTDAPAAPTADAPLPDAPLPDTPPGTASFGALIPLLSQAHGATLSKDFTATGGRVLFFVSASARAKVVGAVISLKVQLDKQDLGTVSCYANDADNAKTLSAAVFAKDVPAGPHTITVVPTNINTILDARSVVDVSALELAAPVRSDKVLDGSTTSGPFVAGGKPGVLLLDATAYRSPAGPMLLNVGLDGTKIGTLRGLTTVAGNHQGLVPEALVVTPMAGSRMLTLSPVQTTTNTGDAINGYWLEPGDDVDIKTLFANPGLPAAGDAGDKPGELLLLVSGSATRQNAGPVVANVEIDGAVVGTISGYVDTPGNHVALTRGVFRTTLSAAPHSVRLALTDTTWMVATADDVFTAVALRFP
jgi:hypothetical protein